MLKQLSIYAENKKGALQTMTNALYEAGINIWGSVTNDGAEYGINRMVVSDPRQGKRGPHREGLPLPFRGCPGCRDRG